MTHKELWDSLFCDLPHGLCAWDLQGWHRVGREKRCNKGPHWFPMQFTGKSKLTEEKVTSVTSSLKPPWGRDNALYPSGSDTTEVT